MMGMLNLSEIQWTQDEKVEVEMEVMNDTEHAEEPSSSVSDPVTQEEAEEEQEQEEEQQQEEEEQTQHTLKTHISVTETKAPKISERPSRRADGVWSALFAEDSSRIPASLQTDPGGGVSPRERTPREQLVHRFGSLSLRTQPRPSPQQSQRIAQIFAARFT